MQIDQLRNVLGSAPFRPFVMHLADGRTIRVEHPEFMAVAPSGRSTIVYGHDDGLEFVDLLLATTIEVPNGKGRAS